MMKEVFEARENRAERKLDAAERGVGAKVKQLAFGIAGMVAIVLPGCIVSNINTLPSHLRPGVSSKNGKCGWTDRQWGDAYFYITGNHEARETHDQGGSAKAYIEEDCLNKKTCLEAARCIDEENKRGKLEDKFDLGADDVDLAD